MVTVAAFGQWPSPISSVDAAAGKVSFAELASDGVALFWLERRPSEGGRQVLIRCPVDGDPEVISPPGANIGSRVHEYGGGAFCLLERPGAPAAVAYTDRADERVWFLEPGQDPIGLTPPPPAEERWSFGDLAGSPDGRWVLAVRERHGTRVVHDLVVLDTHSEGRIHTLVSGRDFLASPRLGPAGQLAWVAWDHPDMSWDAAELWVGELEGGPGEPSVTAERMIAGGVGDSVGQPTWCPDASLVFAREITGWWQPWQWRPGASSLRPLSRYRAEFHGPDWVLGQRTMAPLSDGRLVCRFHDAGRDRLGLLTWRDEASATTSGGGAGVRDAAPGEIHQPCVRIDRVVAHQGGVAWIGAAPGSPAGVWWLGASAIAAGAAPPEIGGPVALGFASSPVLGPDDVSIGKPFTFDGVVGEVHGLYFAPTLGGVEGPAGQAPPLVVFCHGGPTGAVDGGFDVVVQFLTTRGIGVAAIDYGGSSGSGRAYRERLDGQWGILDSEDCIAGARALVENGRADPDRLAIRGTSAGGLTALNALVGRDVFAGAAVWYGVTDLLALAAQTHDFEAHYSDRLIGPLPEAAPEYRRRSPRYRVDEFSGAVLLLQGDADPIVPPAQATAMVEALRARGVPCRYRSFASEGHGFRRAETVAACLEAEVDFYRAIWNLGADEGGW